MKSALFRFFFAFVVFVALVLMPRPVFAQRGGHGGGGGFHGGGGGFHAGSVGIM